MTRRKRATAAVMKLRRLVQSIVEYGDREWFSNLEIVRETKDSVSVRLSFTGQEGKQPTFKLSKAGEFNDPVRGPRNLLRVSGGIVDVLVSPIPKFVLAILLEA